MVPVIRGLRCVLFFYIVRHEDIVISFIRLNKKMYIPSHRFSILINYLSLIVVCASSLMQTCCLSSVKVADEPKLCQIDREGDSSCGEPIPPGAVVSGTIPITCDDLLHITLQQAPGLSGRNCTKNFVDVTVNQCKDATLVLRECSVRASLTAHPHVHHGYILGCVGRRMKGGYKYMHLPNDCLVQGLFLNSLSNPSYKETVQFRMAVDPGDQVLPGDSYTLTVEIGGTDQTGTYARLQTARLPLVAPRKSISLVKKKRPYLSPSNRVG